MVFQEKKNFFGGGGGFFNLFHHLNKLFNLDNKFIDKALTVVSDENKEISKLDQYSDIFRQATEYNFENTPYSPDALL